MPPSRSQAIRASAVLCMAEALYLPQIPAYTFTADGGVAFAWNDADRIPVRARELLSLCGETAVHLDVDNGRHMAHLWAAEPWRSRMLASAADVGLLDEAAVIKSLPWRTSQVSHDTFRFMAEIKARAESILSESIATA